MPTFFYEAVDFAGKKVEGVEDAHDEQELAARLVAKGLQPLRLKRRHKAITLFKPSKKKIGHESLLYFTKELADLIEAGIPLERALAILLDSADDQVLKETIRDIREKIKGGKSLSEALSEYPESFSKLYVNMVRVGELGGVLPDVLRRLDSFLERSREIRKFIVSASIYPAILTIVGIISVLILIIFVVPKFGQIFEDLNQPMPPITAMIIAISTFLQKWWWAMLMGLSVLFLAVKLYLRTEEGHRWWDSIKLRLPLIGPTLLRVELGRLTRTLGTLLETGVPILKGISLAKEVVSNFKIQEAVDQIYIGVRQGKNLSLLMKRAGIFPSIAIHLVAVGEETGKLGPMLIKIADDLDEKVRSDTKMFLSMIEPLTIVIMGLLIGGIILSMLLAIFGINDVGF